MWGSEPSEAQILGVLQGRVVDESGAVIPGASIDVRDESTAFALSAVTDSEGHYHLEALPAGSYTISAGIAGFRTEVVVGLHVDVGRTLVRDFELKVGDRSETVLVRAD